MKQSREVLMRLHGDLGLMIQGQGVGLGFRAYDSGFKLCQLVVESIAWRTLNISFERVLGHLGAPLLAAGSS